MVKVTDRDADDMEGCCHDWFKPPMDVVHEGDMIDKGEAGSYLGHFRHPENARKGHNCNGGMYG